MRARWRRLSRPPSDWVRSGGMSNWATSILPCPGHGVRLARRIDEVAGDLELPYAIETHRDTFTETPESTLALARGFRAATGKVLPLCLDHSHFAVVRHLAPAVFWDRLKEPAESLDAAVQFHLRPFNGHHCQIPVLTPAGRRTPEYLAWRTYAARLFEHLQRQPSSAPVWVVPELGHAAPSYGLTGFGTPGAMSSRW